MNISTQTKEDEIILQLILKGEQEADILKYLEQNNMLTPLSIDRVQSKIMEAKAAQAFQPTHPSRKKIRLYGIVLILIGLTVIGLFSNSPIIKSSRYHPSGYALILTIIGIILVIWPDKGSDNI